MNSDHIEGSAEASRAALVTGCSSGIGKATALALVRAGYPTWASARRIEDLRELEQAGCRVLELDVTDEGSRTAAVRQVEAEHGSVGILVNNAGHGGGGPVEEVPLAQVRETFETNVFGLIGMCQLVLPGMRAQRAGTIVNLGSAAGLVTPPTGCPYSMTKYAVESLCDALRLETTPFGVRVVLIEPGAVRTEFLTKGDRRNSRDAGVGVYEEYKANVLRMTERAHREGASAVLTPDKVAAVIVEAIAARRPRARYKVGSQARVAPRVRRLVGDRAWDAAMRRLVPFPAPR